MDEMRVAERAFRGALWGGVFAAFCVAVGAVRVVFALAAGRDIAGLQPHDAVLLVAYSGGFVLAGALLGILAPTRRTKLGAAVMGLLGAGTVFTAIGLGLAASPDRPDDGGVVFAVVICTGLFGYWLAKEVYEPGPPAV